MEIKSPHIKKGELVMTASMIIVIVLLFVGFALVLGFVFAFELNIGIKPALSITGLAFLLAALAALPFLKI